VQLSGGGLNIILGDLQRAPENCRNLPGIKTTASSAIPVAEMAASLAPLFFTSLHPVMVYG